MKVILTILISFSTTILLSCDCVFIFNDSIANSLIEEVDFVGYVSVVDEFPGKTIGLPENRLSLQGGHVTLRIDSLIKGNQNIGELLYTNQTDSGNCMQLFELGGKYLIAGYQIKEFKRISLDSENGFTPIFDFDETGVFKSSVFENEELNYWNELARNSFVIRTNQCLSKKE